MKRKVEGYLIHFSWCDADRDPPKIKRWTSYWANSEAQLAYKVSQLYHSRLWRPLWGEYGEDSWSKALVKIYQIYVSKVKL